MLDGVSLSVAGIYLCSPIVWINWYKRLGFNRWKSCGRFHRGAVYSSRINNAGSMNSVARNKYSVSVHPTTKIVIAEKAI